MLFVVGGQGRFSGKTSVVSSLIAATAQADWVAVRMLSCCHPREIPASNCRDHVCEEKVANSRTEAGRYLASGARRAYTLRSPEHSMDILIPHLRRLISEHTNVIVETSEYIAQLPADLKLFVAPGKSATELERNWVVNSDAVVVVEPNHLRASLAQKKVFLVPPTTYRSTGLVELARERMVPRMAPTPQMPTGVPLSL